MVVVVVVALGETSAIDVFDAHGLALLMVKLCAFALIEGLSLCSVSRKS